ncbi:tetratricopeptide repeat protein [Pseudochelatococcus sp. B33]
MKWWSDSFRTRAGAASRAVAPRRGRLRAVAALLALALAAAFPFGPGHESGRAWAASARGDAPDNLYERLAGAQDEREARRIEVAITRTWLRSGSPTADLLASRAHAALGLEDVPLAIELLDRAIALAPDWAEAYARRGQIFAAIGDDERAVADFNQVLAYNERHFVVLATLAGIFDRTGVRQGALTLYERALAINPHMQEVRRARDRLRLLVEGQPL